MVRYFLLAGLGLLALGGDAYAVSKASAETAVKHATRKVVRQQDGRVVERIVLPASNASALPDRPLTQEKWVQNTLDPAWMARMAKDPALFAQWLDAVTEPRFMTALATVAARPETYPNAMGRLFQPDTLRNWSEVPTPGLLMSWMAAGMNPSYAIGMLARMTDPAKLRRWANCALPAPPAQAAVAPQTNRWLTLPPGEQKTNPWLAGANVTPY